MQTEIYVYIKVYIYTYEYITFESDVKEKAKMLPRV